MIKNLSASAGDMGSIPGLGRSPGEENGNPLQYSCLETTMDRRYAIQSTSLLCPWSHKELDITDRAHSRLVGCLLCGL